MLNDIEDVMRDRIPPVLGLVHERAGLSWARFALRIGATYDEVKFYRKGRRSPNKRQLLMLLDLAREVECIDEVLDDLADPPPRLDIVLNRRPPRPGQRGRPLEGFFDIPSELDTPPGMARVSR